MRRERGTMMRSKAVAGLKFVADGFVLLPIGVMVALAWAYTCGKKEA